MRIRLMKKAVKMTLREKRMFVIFTGIYTILIFLTSFFIETMSGSLTEIFTNPLILIFVSTSLVLSLLYAWLLVSRNRRIFATLKCIGYENKNINFMIAGIILFTMVLSFIFVIEVLFHYAAIKAYLISAGLIPNTPIILVSLLPVVTTFFIFLVVQIIAIILANRKVLKVRPVQALKRVGG